MPLPQLEPISFQDSLLSSVIDHIYAVNANGLEARCLISFNRTSDHHPIISRIPDSYPPDDSYVN